MTDALIVAAAYVIGSIPFTFLLSRRRGVDLRQVGSGNVGASNVLRAEGLRRAMIALVLDGIKGTVAVFFAVRFASDAATPVVAGLASIAGHVFPVWLNFRGGKGVATSAGVFAVLAPSSLGVAAGVFLATVWVTRHISVGSLAGATALVLSTAVANPLDVFFGAIVAAGMIGHRHRSNVSRLRAGTERRINLRLQQSTKVTDDGD